MIVPFVDLKTQYLSIKDEIDNAIASVLAETVFIGGNRVREFEKRFADLYQCKHCISVGNGTDALYIVLKMLGVGPGDEVITSAVSWISSSETITQTGARPVFVDIHPETYTIDPSRIEAKITARTKAILPVHLYGQAAHITSIKEICLKHGLLLVEDCAQAHLTEEFGCKVGLFGNAGTFSFYPGKNLGAYGDAGAIITNDEALAEKVRMYANHGALVKHEHLIEGLNSRLDSIQAAILKVKASHILEWTARRIAHAQKYNELLHESHEVTLPALRKETRHTFHLYVIRTPKRNELKGFLEQKGIQVSIHYPLALPFLKAYSYLQAKAEDFPIASRHQHEILSLPMYPELTNDQIEYVCASIKEFYSTYA